MRSRLASAYSAMREILRDAARDGSAANVPMMAAAISYYLLVTLAPLAFLLAIGAQTIRPATALSPGVEGAMVAEAFGALFEQSSWAAALLWLALFGFGATGVFSQLVLAVGRIWNEPPKNGPLGAFARRRFIAFLLLCVLAAGLLGSMVVGTVLSAATNELIRIAESLGAPVPGVGTLAVERFVIDLVASFALFVTAFSLIPARKILARDVLSGAVVTAVAFALGQVGLSFYLARTNSVELAAGVGNFIAVMLWAYYSAMIALYGAVLSRVIVLRKERAAAAG